MSKATLARRTLGAGSLLVFAVGASSPLTVLAGGVVATYAATGVTGVPLSFLIIMLALSLLVVGYIAVSRHIVHSAPFYAQLCQGIGPSVGVAGAAIALVGYNAIQISLYGLLGYNLANLFHGAWWMWAAGAWLLVALMGRFRGAENARILGTLLVVEIATIVLFDIAAFSNPAEGVVTAVSWEPSSLMVTGASGALAFAMAAFTGVESPPAFGEEARSSQVTARATMIGIVFLGVFYAVTAWGYAVAVGPSHVAEAAADPNRGPFSVLSRIYGPGLDTVANVLLVTSVLAAMSAFHGMVARYVFALAREHVLPAALTKVSGGAKGGAPLGGSILQSTVAGVVIVVFALMGADPMTTMFVWLSAIGAVCILLLLTVSSVAALLFFTSGRGAGESVLTRQVVPIVGAVLGFLLLVFMVSNLASLLGIAPGSLLPLLVVAIVIVTAVVGVLWGMWIRRTHPEIYQELGQGTPDPLTAQDARLKDLVV